MNLSAIRTRVRSLTSILSPSILSDAEMDAFINEAQTLICLTADWPFLQYTATVTASAGDDTVTFPLPAGRSAQRVIDVFASTEPGAKPWQLFERAQPRIVETNPGHPREYEWVAATGELRLYPTPTAPATVHIRVVLDPKALSTGTDVPDIPTSFRHGVAYMASALILEREADTTGRIAAYESRVGEVIEEMRRLLLTSGRASFTLGGRVSGRRSARRQVW